MSTTGWKLGSLNITLALGQNDTCDFQVEDPSQAVSFIPGQNVGVLNFSGVIQSAKVSYVEGGGNDNPTLNRWMVRCIGPQIFARDRLTQQKSWASAYAEAILSDIGAMVGLAVSFDGPALSFSIFRFQTDVEPLGEALTRLAAILTGLTGSQFVWQISGGSIHLFAFPTVYPSNVLGVGPGLLNWKRGSLSVEQILDPSAVNTVVLKHDRYLLRRRAPSGSDPGIGDESYTGTQVIDDALELLFPLAGAPLVSVNGVNQLVGIDGVDDVVVDFTASFTGIDTSLITWPGVAYVDVPTDYLWFWSAGSNILRYAGPGLSSSDAIRVQYQPLDVRYLVVKDTGAAAFFGTRQRVVTLGDTLSSAYPALEAIARLRLGAQASTIVRCTVRAESLLHIPGQSLGFVAGDTVGQFLTTRARYRNEGLLIWCDLEMVQGPIAMKMMEFMGGRR